MYLPGRGWMGKPIPRCRLDQPLVSPPPSRAGFVVSTPLAVFRSRTFFLKNPVLYLPANIVKNSRKRSTLPLEFKMSLNNSALFWVRERLNLIISNPAFFYLDDLKLNTTEVKDFRNKLTNFPSPPLPFPHNHH